MYKPEELKSIAIIIPVYNEAAFLPTLMENLQALLLPLPTKVYFVDGGSTDSTSQLITDGLAQLPFSGELLHNPLKLPAGALNIAIEAATEDLIIRLDGHTGFPPDYLEQVVDLFRRHPEIAMTGAALTNCGRSFAGRINALAMSSAFGMGGSATRIGGDVEQEVDTIAFPAFRRSLYTEIGPFDINLPYAEDDEFNFRVIQAGYSILYTPRIRARYYVRDTRWQMFMQMWNYGRGKVRSARKHRRPTNLRQLVPTLFVLYLLALLFVVWLAPWTILPLLAYLLLSLFFAIRPSGIRFPLLMLTFLVMHVGYGLGYLRQLTELRK